MNSTERKELLKTYMSYGLSKPFAIAIVEGANPEPILEFWEKDWHKQYEGGKDDLVKAVLDQTITPEEGEWLNSVRSNHEDLIQLCLDGSCTIEWAKSLMEAGFLNHSKEVSDILKGADPIVIGKLSGIELQFDLLPPKLEMKTKNTDPISRNFQIHEVGAPVPLPKGEIVASIECINCKALVSKSATTKCPYCKFQLVWEWDRLSVQERESVGFFMRDFLPGISYQNNSALIFMQFLSTLSDGVTYAEFRSIITNSQSECLTWLSAVNLAKIEEVALRMHDGLVAPHQRRLRRFDEGSTRIPAIPAMIGKVDLDGRPFEDVWIRGMIAASKFWGRRY